MPKEFSCPSCSEPVVFQGGESIFQTCKACNAPVIVPSDMLYKTEQKLASEDFASLVNDKSVDVEQVTNELTPGSEPPAETEMLDPEAKIEKFEVYQNKIGTDAVETKKAVDEIIAPKKDIDFRIATPYANLPEEKNNPKQQMQLHPTLVRIQNELESGDKFEAIKIFRDKFKTGLQEAKESVEAIERGEQIDISQFVDRGSE